MGLTSRDGRAEFIALALASAETARELGAPIVPGIAAAQAALESRYGDSRLALANNLLGIKAGQSWAGPTLDLPTREWVAPTEQPLRAGHWITVTARWRRYASWADCFVDYGKIIARLSWYADAAEAAKRGDARAFLEGLLAKPNGPGAADDEPGWATDPSYREKVLGIAEQWGLV